MALQANEGFLGEGAEMSWRESFTAEEWSKLQLAPFYVFFAVAGADRKIDDKEVRAMSRALSAARLLPGALVAEVVESLAADQPRPAPGAMDLRGELQNVRRLLERKVPRDEADKFKGALLVIGLNVGKASGGFLGLGSKLSKKEKETIAGLAFALGVSV